MQQATTQEKGAGEPIPDPDAASSASASSPDDSASLDQYFRCVCPPRRTTLSRPPYQDRPPAHPPILHKGRTNRILLYNGCFNPPHRGHLAHLKHAFQHSGADLHVVGAVVLVASDEYVRWKLGPKNALAKLTVEQRVSLWKAGLNAVGGEGQEDEGEEGIDWCWVLSESNWARAVGHVAQQFKNDGFDVAFVHLVGGDKFRGGSVAHGTGGCRITLTTDVSRPVGFYDDARGLAGLPPRQLRDHTLWARVPQQPGEEAQSGRRVYTCAYSGRRHPHATYTLRFVTAAPSERVDPKFSSTNVRAIIDKTYMRTRGISAEARIKELGVRLRGVAVQPDLLAKYLVEGWEKKNGSRSWSATGGLFH